MSGSGSRSIATGCATCTLRTLFAHDPGRFERFSHRIDDLLVDCSKQRITDETVRLLVELAAATGRRGAARPDVRRRRHQRAPSSARCCTSRCAGRIRTPLLVGGRDVMPAGATRPGRTSATSATRCVRARGPAPAAHRIDRRRQPRHRRLRPRAGDGHRGAGAVRPRGPAAALRLQRRRRAPGRDAARLSIRRRRSFIVASKTFTTQETMANARIGPRLAGRRAGRGRRRPRTSSPCRPTPPKCSASASRPTTCSCSGTGSAAATRCGRRSGCRSRIAIGADHFDAAAGRRQRCRRALPVGGR